MPRALTPTPPPTAPTCTSPATATAASAASTSARLAPQLLERLPLHAAVHLPYFFAALAAGPPQHVLPLPQPLLRLPACQLQVLGLELGKVLQASPYTHVHPTGEGQATYMDIGMKWYRCRVCCGRRPGP